MNYTGSIKNRLIGIILLVTVLIGTIGYSTFVYWYMQNQNDRALKLSNTVGLLLGQDFAKLILLNDVAAAADISSQLKSFENLKSMVLYKLDESVIFQYNIENKTLDVSPLPKKVDRISTIENNTLKLYIDAKYQDTHLGFIELCFRIETLNDIIKRDIKVLILIFLLMFILSYILSEYFAKRFTRPILNLVRFLEKIESQESLNKKITTNENNEFGKLYEEVNTMLARIDNSQKALKIASVAFETQSGIIITDKFRKILQVNKSFTRITGYKPHEIIGKTPSVLKSGLHNEEFYNKMSSSLKYNKFWIGEIKNRHKNGNIVNENLTIQAVLDDDEEPLYYVASFLDMTKQKEVEKQLQEKERMLVHQSKMAAMGEMIGNIAHQWRQPLSVISSISTSLQVQKELKISNFSDTDLEQLKKIDHTIAYLSQTIEDFREFFKPDKEKTIFNLEHCYKKTSGLLQSKFKSLNIEFIENIESDINIFNLENELMQVIMNILNNARDAIENKSIKKKLIFVDIKKVDRNAIISIKDNAGGVPNDIIDKIFDPYFTTKHKSQGTGIGLYMSQEMTVKHLGGILEVINLEYTHKGENHRGACFKIILPIK